MKNWQGWRLRSAINKWKPTKSQFEVIYNQKIQQVRERFQNPVSEQRQRAKLSKTHCESAKRQQSQLLRRENEAAQKARYESISTELAEKAAKVAQRSAERNKVRIQKIKP